MVNNFGRFLLQHDIPVFKMIVVASHIEQFTFMASLLRMITEAPRNSIHSSKLLRNVMVAN